MKVRALMDCKGVGYDLKKGDVADLPKGLVTLLIRFGYVEEVKKSKETKVKE